MRASPSALGTSWVSDLNTPQQPAVTHSLLKQVGGFSTPIRTAARPTQQRHPSNTSIAALARITTFNLN